MRRAQPQPYKVLPEYKVKPAQPQRSQVLLDSKAQLEFKASPARKVKREQVRRA